MLLNDVKSLFLGGIKFDRAVIGQTVTIMQDAHYATMFGTLGDTIVHKGTKYNCVGAFYYGGLKYIVEESTGVNLGFVSADKCTISGGYSLPRLFARLRNIFTPRKVVA